MLAQFVAWMIYLFLFFVVFSKVYEAYMLFSDQEKWFSIYWDD